MMRFSVLSAKVRFIFAAALAGFAAAGPDVAPSISSPRATETRHGRRSGTVAQAKRAALKMKRRKAHRMHCR